MFYSESERFDFNKNTKFIHRFIRIFHWSIVLKQNSLQPSAARGVFPISRLMHKGEWHLLKVLTTILLKLVFIQFDWLVFNINIVDS